MVTEVLLLHAPFVTVHWNVEAAPTVKPVTPEVALLGVVATPVPDVVVHAPVPGDGLLPAKVAVVVLHMVCAVPAFEVTGDETVIVTVLFALHAPFVTVHWKVEAAPTVNPVTPEEALLAVVATPVPDTVVHAPVPGAGLLPAKVAVVALHIVCAVPAFEVTGDETVIVTVLFALHAPFVTVHWNVEAAPTVKPVTPEEALLGVVATPVPAVVVHAPVPGDGLLPAKVAEVALHIVCAVPAFDVTGDETVIVTVLFALHAPLVTVHWNVEAAPTVNPVTPEEALLGVVATPVPAVVVHAPVPGDGLLPAKVPVVVLHMVCAVPAFEVTGEETVMVTVLLAEHAPLVTVQRNVVAAPTVKPVTPEVALLAVVATPVPDTVVHAPVPGAGLLPAKVAVVALQIVCAVPAFEVTGDETVIVTVLFALHAPFVTVHWNVEAAPTVKPVTPEVALLGVVATPEPAVVVQAPVPGDGLLPAKVAVVALHIACAVPALEVTGAKTVMVTLSNNVGQLAAVTVHLNTVGVAVESPVTPELMLFGVVATPGPLTVVHVPTPPASGVKAAKLVVLVLHKL
jgi:hypothetical protein